MNQYEAVFILTPVLSEIQMTEAVEKFKGILTAEGAVIVNEENWGLRKLAYPIDKKSTGAYRFVEFNAEPAVVDKLEIQFRRDERVLRFLTLRQDKFAAEYAAKRRGLKKAQVTNPPAPEAAPAAKPVRAPRVVTHPAPVAAPIAEPIVEPVVEPIIETPAVEAVAAPVVEPIVETPAVEAPVVETPIVETPIVEAAEPVAEAPIEEAPAPVEEAPEAPAQEEEPKQEEA
jgi:small subunit ribosomal protein S6